MTLRKLTIDEMMHQKDGDLAVVTLCTDNLYDPGTQLKRRNSFADDYQSVAYYIGPDFESYEYFEEGEVAVVEVAAKEQLDRPSDELGMFRPELESRKIGKIRVELVDDGFPLALREVAKVMTWAQTAKGYKDHDWQNLPNAEVALAAAASRHRTDHIKQRVVDGLLIERCVDGESGLLHKAHEAFGVLAQLELMLRGEFDTGLDSPQ